MTEKEWYSDREMFEMIQSLKQDLTETRATIKKYNGLWEKLDGVDERLAAMEQQKAGRSSVSKGIREWGGWIVAILALIAAYVKLFL